MKTRAEARAWTKVEAICKQLESMGEEAFAIPNVFEIHHLGAEVADILGQTQLRQIRLVRERDWQEKAGEPITSSAFRKVFEFLGRDRECLWSCHHRTTRRCRHQKSSSRS